MIEVSAPNWRPLERLLSREECSGFMYMGHFGTIELYKHRDTQHYLNFDAVTGEFYLYGNNTFIKARRFYNEHGRR